MILTAVRTNTRFGVNYENSNLVPEIELILIFQQPKYVEKKGKIVKDWKIEEFRITTDTAGINNLIGQLQATVSGLNNIEQLASGINAMIDANKPKTT